jgi:hypothetical protein
MNTRKRVIKLDENALRSLIKEAIHGRQPGSPLFTPPVEKKRRLKESIASGAELEALMGACADQWHSLADADDDPSIGAVGSDGWDEQVQVAVDELRQRIVDACDEIEQQLIDGQFYGGF